MFARSVAWRVSSSKFNTPLLFCKFTDGSRRVSLRPRVPHQSASGTDSASPDAVVHVVPMSHAATKDFFDGVIEFISAEFASAGIPDPHNCPDAKRGSVKVVMEGLASSDQDRQVEQQEWAYISNQVIAARQGDKAADQFLYSFTQKVETNTLFLPDTLKGIAEGYQLPYPLPDGLMLQDAYLRPLLAARFGPHLASGDICLSDYPPAEQQALMQNHQRLRDERERHCSDAIRKLIAAGVSTVIVPWGHFHTPPIMGHLMSPAVTQTASSIANGAFDVADAEASPRQYGWTDEMLDSIYGSDGPVNPTV